MVKMELLYNKLTSKDYNGLRKTVNWDVLKPKRVEKILDKSFCTIVVKKDCQAIGMGRLVGDGLIFFVMDVVVNPVYQRQGVGTKILNSLIDYVRKETPFNDFSIIQLISEKGKENFYMNLGFTIVPNDETGSGMQIFIKNKEL